MNKLKALIVTLVVGSSSVAMASPATFTARGSVSFHASTPSYSAPRPVIVRDHRPADYVHSGYRTDYRHDYRSDYRYNDHFDDHFDHDDDHGFTLTGTYSSAFGPVQLWQDGDRISGTFTSGGGGTIRGRIVGNEIHFTWKNTGEKGRGTWYVSNPNRIDGTWGKNRSDSDGGAWNLKRS